MKNICIVFLAFFLASCAPTHALPNFYEASVTQIGGEGSHVVSKSAWISTENITFSSNEADTFVLTRFNTPEDVMWTNCAEGYVLSDCKSDTNDVMPDHAPGCGILLTDQIKNIVQISCRK